MDGYQQLIPTLALTMGTAWASGINLYATLCVLGILGITGNITLPDQLQIVQDPVVIGAAGFMYCVEFFADKTPGVDTAWDAIHSFIRIPAGTVLAAGAVGEVSPSLAIAAGILGGTVSATSHMVKSGSRVIINTSPEPVSNWTASLVEDIGVIGGLFTALHYPLIFLVLLIIFLLIAIWLLPKLWRAILKIFQMIKKYFASRKKSVALPPPK